MACGAGCWLPEGVSNPAPLPPQYLCGHRFKSRSLSQILISLDLARLILKGAELTGLAPTDLTHMVYPCKAVLKGAELTGLAPTELTYMVCVLSMLVSCLTSCTAMQGCLEGCGANGTCTRAAVPLASMGRNSSVSSVELAGLRDATSRVRTSSEPKVEGVF